MVWWTKSNFLSSCALLQCSKCFAPHLCTQNVGIPEAKFTAIREGYIRSSQSYWSLPNVIGPRNSTLFTRLFLIVRRTWAGMRLRNYLSGMHATLTLSGALIRNVSHYLWGDTTSPCIQQTIQFSDLHDNYGWLWLCYCTDKTYS